MCGVCGNMSTGRARSSRYPHSAGEVLHVAGQRRRVARHVDDPLRLESRQTAQRLAGETGPRRVDDDDVRIAGAFVEVVEHLADLAGEERRVRDAVQLGVLERARDGLLRDLDTPDRERVGGEREPDRPDAAVEVVDALLARQLRVLAREPVEPFGHRGVRLEEGVRADPEAQAAELLLDRLVPVQELRRQVRDLGRPVVDRPVDRAHLRETHERGDEALRVELAGGGDQLDEHLAGVPALADHEMAKKPGVLGLVVRLEALRPRPVACRLADRVPEIGRQPAAADVEHLVPAAGAVEAERRPLRRLS